VGQKLEKRGSSKEIFRRWIETYASEEYASIVRQVLEAMDQVARELTDKQKEMVRNHFIITSKLEYLFWDMGLNEQTWTV
jgi:thiaminase/transcriptional activator TenA